jgi:hypothetical protein
MRKFTQKEVFVEANNHSPYATCEHSGGLAGDDFIRGPDAAELGRPTKFELVINF